MTQEARDDRLLGVLFLTARTSLYRPPVVRAVEVDAFSPVLRGPRGMEDRAC
jgi:hypothetical protein